MTITIRELQEGLNRYVNQEQSLYFRTCGESMEGEILLEQDILNEYEETFGQVTDNVNYAIVALSDAYGNVQYFEISTCI